MNAPAGDDELDFERWYRREHPQLVSGLTVVTGSPDVAADVSAEAFVRAYERWDRVGTMESPTGWVWKVALNLVRRRARRAAVEDRLLRRRAADRPGESPSPALEPAVWAAVRGLPVRQRSVIALRVILDLSQDDTARWLGIRPGTVSATLVTARRSLLRLLGEDEDGASRETESDHARSV